MAAPAVENVAKGLAGRLRSELISASVDSQGGVRSEGWIALVANLETPFVTIDHKILDEAFGCEIILVKRSPGGVFRSLIKVARARAGVGWFASWHTLPVALFFVFLRRPFLLIIGGYDLANMPEIEYGHQRGGAKKWMALTTMRLATRLMTNSFYSLQEAETNAGLDPKKIGMVYHGVPDAVGRLPDKGPDPLVITVGNVDRANLHRKGHEPFVRAAAMLPDVEFRLIGAWKDDAIDYLKSIATPNVKFTGRLSDEDLNDALIDASVYVQASAHEGFGMSLAEAMLAGCVPVVSSAGAIPEVVGDAGFYLPEVNPESVAHTVQDALSSVGDFGARARARIVRHFPTSVRRDGLVAEVNGILGKKTPVI